MAIYRNYRQLFRLIGGNVGSNTLVTIDEVLSNDTINQSTGGLILNNIKSRGISGDTTLRSLINNVANFSILSDTLRLVGTVNKVDNDVKLFNSESIYTNENKSSLNENDLSVFEYTGNTFCLTSLSKKGDDLVSIGNDLYIESHRLTGVVNLDGDDSVYFIPLGLIEMGLNSYEAIEFGQNNTSVMAKDLEGSLTLTNPMIQGCFLSDESLDVITTDIAEINLIPGQQLGLGPDDYFLGLIIGSFSDDVNGKITIDQKINVIKNSKQLGLRSLRFTNISGGVTTLNI